MSEPALPSIRTAMLADAPALAGLMGQLGYEAGEALIACRLGILAAHAFDRVLLAGVVGVAAGVISLHVAARAPGTAHGHDRHRPGRTGAPYGPVRRLRGRRLALPSGRSRRAGGQQGRTGLQLYGGLRFTENFGIEDGYAQLGKFSERVRQGGTEIEQQGKGRVLYAAATGRIPVTDAIAINARAGIAQGRVSGRNVLPASANPIGRERGLMLGGGREYGLSRSLAITADYDHFGKLSRAAKGGLVTVGLRASF